MFTKDALTNSVRLLPNNFVRRIVARACFPMSVRQVEVLR